MSHNGYLPFLAREIVGIVLLAAAISKLRSRRWTTLSVEMGTPKVVVISLPAAEALVGLALVLQMLPEVMPWVAVALFGVFTAVVWARYLSGSRALCNCFGDKGGPVTRLTIVRNVILLAIAIVATT